VLPVPDFEGVIDRRILVNFRVDPEPLDDVLPEGFRPRTVESDDGEVAVGGVCCIRLKNLRPRGLPSAVGFTSENAAHRIGVEWDDEGETQSGVYVPRRDTSSRLNSVVGDRLFGRHYHAEFDVREGDGEYSLEMESSHDGVGVRVEASEATTLPDESVFDELPEASEYHKRGSAGTRRHRRARVSKASNSTPTNGASNPSTLTTFTQASLRTNYPTTPSNSTTPS